MDFGPEVDINVARKEGVDFVSQKTRFEKRTFRSKTKCPLSCEWTFEWCGIREFRNEVQVCRGCV